MLPSLIPARRPGPPRHAPLGDPSAESSAAGGEPTAHSYLQAHGGQRTSAAAWRFLLSGLAEICYPPTCVLCHGPFETGPLANGPVVADPWGEVRRCNGSQGAAPTEAPEPAEAAVDARASRRLCETCRVTLQATAAKFACDRCSRPQPPVSPSATPDSSGPRWLCPACGKRSSKTPSSGIERSVALGMYRDVMREAVVAAKRLSFQPLALALGEMLGERVREAWRAVPIGAVTYIPSHWLRRLGRKGCPAQLLAHQVGRVIGAPVVPMLRSCRRTAKQGTLGDAERRTNVCGAFKAKKGYALLAPRVLVVDDVWTTGATLEEAARVIRQGYDAEIFAAVVARAIGTHDG